MDDLRAELEAAFAAELAEHLAAIRAALADADAGRAIDLREVSRRAHSLKGAARAVELADTEAIAHEAETLLLAIEQGEAALDAAAVARLRLLTDGMEDSARLRGPDAAEPVDPAAGRGEERLRVSAAHVEALSRSLGDLAVQAQDQDGIAEDLAALAGELQSLALLAEREGAPETARRLVRAGTDAGRRARDQARLAAALDRTGEQLERDAERIMLLPIATLFDGYERMVRDLATSQGKSATLSIDATDGEADRRVLQGLREPLLHLLRNAVSHGIEPPARRSAAGKPAAGEVRISARAGRGRLVLTIDDDGGGLDYARIAERARAAGLLEAGRRADPALLRRLLFEQGFSTATTIDEVSGRGVGLSVVAETLRRLHGQIDLSERAGGGTRVRLSVPLALSRQTLLLVEAGGGDYALPADTVVRLLRIAAHEIEQAEATAMVVIDGQAVPLLPLADLLGLPPGEGADTLVQAALIDTGTDRALIAVDRLRDVRALLVGDPTALAVDAPLVYGTALIDGRAALVLGPDALLARRHGLPTGRARPIAAPTPERRTILVVDDSITTRTLEKSILEAQGYRVLVAVDGLAGLETLRAGIEPIDLVVADVEMPRMDGFGLLQAVRNDPALSALPVIMMTSRNSPDDIQRGLDLGASAYATKQAFDQGELLAIVQQLI